MARKKTVRYAVTADGERHVITGENGRYWVCGDAQIRKSRAVVEKEAAPGAEEPHGGVIDQEARGE